MLDPAAFIKENCTLLPGPLAPEIKLYQANEAKPLWHAQRDDLERMTVGEPFWAFAWAGGQALARYILDEPQVVYGKSVLSFAAGAGAEAIAAKLAGASRVVAADIDPYAQIAVTLNAEANSVAVDIETADLLVAGVPRFDVLLVGDVFYDRDLAKRLWPWLLEAKVSSMRIVIGDPGRTYLPREKLQTLATYRLQDTSAFEDSDLRSAKVWQIRDDMLAFT